MGWVTEALASKEAGRLKCLEPVSLPLIKVPTGIPGGWEVPQVSEHGSSPFAAAVAFQDARGTVDHASPLAHLRPTQVRVRHPNAARAATRRGAPRPAWVSPAPASLPVADLSKGATACIGCFLTRAPIRAFHLSGWRTQTPWPCLGWEEPRLSSLTPTGACHLHCPGLLRCSTVTLPL